MISCPVALVIALVMLAAVCGFVLWAVVDVARHHDDNHERDLREMARRRDRDPGGP